MYIKQQDFYYMEGLYRTLDADGRKRFIDVLMKSYCVNARDYFDKIKIVDDDIFDRQAIDPKEFITKTAIKKAYKESKNPKA